MVRLDAVLATTLVAGGCVGSSEAAEQASSYTPTGIGMGGFRLYPELELGVGSTDNVFATELDQQSDMRLVVIPQARLVSEWSTHALNLSLAAPSYVYSKFSSQDSIDVFGEANGQLDIDRTSNITAKLGFGYFQEPLTRSPNPNIAEPVPYTTASIDLGFSKTFNRLQLSADTNYAKVNFEDQVDFNGVLIDQDDRDHGLLIAAVRADYSIGAATSLFVSASANRRDYELAPPAAATNRDSEGYEAIAGITFEVTNIINAEIGGGYLRQIYDAIGVEDTSGLAARASLRWQPDSLVNVSIDLQRGIRDAGAEGAVSYIGNDAGIKVNYAYRRNIDVGVQANYGLDEYNNIDREDRRWSARADLTYKINRSAAIYLGGTHEEQTSSGLDSGRAFEVNRAEIGIRVRR